MALVLLMGTVGLWADPLQPVGPDQRLYQRVRALGAQGLLAPQDQAVLDSGQTVTRLQLAFYVETAEKRIKKAPPTETPVPPAPTETPVSVEPTDTPIPADQTLDVTPQAPEATATPKPKKIKATKAVKKALKAPTVLPASTKVPVKPPVNKTALKKSVPIQAPTAVPVERSPEPAKAKAFKPAVEMGSPDASGSSSNLLRAKDLARPGTEKPAEPTVTSPAARPVSEKALALPASSMPSDMDMVSPPPATPAAHVGTPVPASTKAHVTGPEREIEDLLRQLRQESALIREKLQRDSRKAASISSETARLKAAQDEVNKVARKAAPSGSVKLDSLADLRAENIALTGLAHMNAYRTYEELNVVFTADLSGLGSLSVGLTGSTPFSNASGGPASIGTFAPSLNFPVNGTLGHWNGTVAIEAYSGDTDLGDFTRGQTAGTNRFEKPFDLKNYSQDSNLKTWNDYMDNLGYVPSTSNFTTGSNSVRVFDGLFMTGDHVPLLGNDAKMTILLGRTLYANQWEEGVKIARPLFHGKMNLNLSSLWVNDHFGAPTTVAGSPATVSGDLKSYSADLGIGWLPVFLELEGGISTFGTGTDSLQPPDPKDITGGAFQATASYYPFAAYFTSISPDYMNFQSKVAMAGSRNARFGYADTATYFTQQGYVGMADDLVSDRTGGRINLGWKGRQSPWMKSWPSFLDALVVNVDAALKREYRMEPNIDGYNTIQANDLVSVYYPDGTGLWGSSIWGNYNGPIAASTAYLANLQGVRNDGTVMANYIGLGMGFTEQVPFILPVLDANGRPQTDGSGHNRYTLLDHLKTYRYLTATTKVQLNKLFHTAKPFYGGFFVTDHQVSGTTTDPVVAAMPDPNRPGQTLANIPNLFTQRVYDSALMYQVMKNVDLMVHYAFEKWTSFYTWPKVDRRTEAPGLGFAWDIPWGGAKLEARYNRVLYRDAYVSANNYRADQAYLYVQFKF